MKNGEKNIYPTRPYSQITMKKHIFKLFENIIGRQMID